MCLLYIADQVYQNSAEEVIKIHQSTDETWLKASLWINLPSSNEDTCSPVSLAKCICFQFYLEFCIAHIFVQMLSECEDAYIEQKEFANINVPATWNSQDKFTSVDVYYEFYYQIIQLMSCKLSPLYLNLNFETIFKRPLQDTSYVIKNNGHLGNNSICRSYRNNFWQQWSSTTLRKRDQLGL